MKYQAKTNEGIATVISTIFRHFESMVEEGIVAKFIIDENSNTCFGYLIEEKLSDEILFILPVTTLSAIFLLGVRNNWSE